MLNLFLAVLAADSSVQKHVLLTALNIQNIKARENLRLACPLLAIKWPEEIFHGRKIFRPSNALVIYKSVVVLRPLPLAIWLLRVQFFLNFETKFEFPLTYCRTLRSSVTP
jgi:hypothetical protein